MLGLLHPTDPQWVETVERDLDQLLSDHAHCELKAAHTALSLVARFGGEAPEIVAPLLALAHEETDHFGQVHERIHLRNSKLSPPSSDAYVCDLMKSTKGERDRYPQLLDRLLVSALIEARSCERFRLLADHLKSVELCAFYRDLMASEARHYRLFASLAERRFGAETARARLTMLAEREASVARCLPLGATVHG